MNIQRRRENSICVHIEFTQKGHQLAKCNSQKNQLGATQTNLYFLLIKNLTINNDCIIIQKARIFFSYLREFDEPGNNITTSILSSLCIGRRHLLQTFGRVFFIQYRQLVADLKILTMISYTLQVCTNDTKEYIEPCMIMMEANLESKIIY